MLTEHRAFGRFLLVGAVCAALNLTFLWVATDQLGLHYLLSALVSFICINAVGFVLNKYYTFSRPQARVLSELFKYYATMLGSMVLNLLLMAVLVSGFRIHYLVASLVVTMVMMLANFLAHSSWTFGMHEPRA